MTDEAEEKLCLDIDQLAGIEAARKKPLWWKPREEKTLAERLDERVAREKTRRA